MNKAYRTRVKDNSCSTKGCPGKLPIFCVNTKYQWKCLIFFFQNQYIFFILILFHFTIVSLHRKLNRCMRNAVNNFSLLFFHINQLLKGNDNE